MKEIVLDCLKKYPLNFNCDSYRLLSTKTCVLNNQNTPLVLKKTNTSTNELYNLLKSLGCNNVIYPVKTKTNHQYVSKVDDAFYCLLPYVKDEAIIDEIKITYLLDELKKIHEKTTFRKPLSKDTSKKKLGEIYNYLQYKFNMLETFVRTIEAREFDEYSIMILKDYQYILDAKKIMGKLNKKIIDYIKEGLVVDYSFIHNNPKLSHLLNDNGNLYLISLEKSRIGIPSLDICKLYIETEDVNCNKYEIFSNYFKSYDSDFYFDYFCFLVFLYYIKSIIIIDKDYISSQSFVYTSGAIKNFIKEFKLKN